MEKTDITSGRSLWDLWTRRLGAFAVAAVAAYASYRINAASRWLVAPTSPRLACGR